MTIRVVVADDQDLVRTGLVMILGAQPDLEVVGKQPTGSRRSIWRPGCVPMFSSSTSGCPGSTGSR